MGLWLINALDLWLVPAAFYHQFQLTFLYFYARMGRCEIRVGTRAQPSGSTLFVGTFTIKCTTLIKEINHGRHGL